MADPTPIVDRAAIGVNQKHGLQGSHDRSRAGPGRAFVLELDEFFGEMTQVQPFFLGDQTYPPLLHRQGAEQDFDGPAIFVAADIIDYVSIGGNGVAFDARHQNGGSGLAQC